MSQHNLIENLKKDIAEGLVVVVTGTGVSIAICQDQLVDGFHVARWNGLLKHGINQCQNVENVLNDGGADAINSMIDFGESDFLITAAELISQRLNGKSPGSFHRWLKDSIGTLTPTHPELIQILAESRIPLLTLNYDGLMEEITKRVPVTWDERDKVEEIIRHHRYDSIIHLHGYFDKPDSIVLGLASYNKVSKDPHTETVLRLFTLDHTILFIGCDGTLQDPNFTRLIEWGREALKESTHKHYVLCQKSNKNNLIKILRDAPWLVPIEYGENYDDLLPFLQSLVPSRVSEQSEKKGFTVETSVNLVTYAKAIKESYAKLPLESLDVTGVYYRELDLWQVFIPQNVREIKDYLPKLLELPKDYLQKLRKSGHLDFYNFEQGKFEELNRRYLDQPSRNIFDLMDDINASRVVILGDPGSGKSSLIQAFALRWADQSIDEWQKNEIPLIIELRRYDQHKRTGGVKDFINFIEKGLGVPYSINREVLDNWLNTGRVCFFFDGLDEVFDPVVRDEVVTAIQRFSNTYPLVKIIVTSRVIGYKGEKFLNSGFSQFMLQDLDSVQIATFLEKWYNRTYPHKENIEKDLKRNRLTRSIEESQHIRELAGNPLLLTMMAILNRYRDLPRDRAELYKECSKLLLQQWKVEESLKADPDIASDALAIGFAEKETILRHLAREMQTRSSGVLGNIISEGQLETIIEDVIKLHVKGNPHVITRALIKHLRERNFILCYIGGNSYAFIHRTFLEYFCAEDLRLRFEHEKSISIDYLKKKVYGAHWDDETWNEVLLLLAGTIHVKSVAIILEFLIKQEDPGQTCQHIFLAARCISEVRKKSDLGNISDRVKSLLTDLIDFDLKFKYRGYEEIRKINEIQYQAFKLRVNIWHDDAEASDWIKEFIKSKTNLNLITTALMELARLWRDDPDTITFIKSLINPMEGNELKVMAISELGTGWKDNPETILLLKDIVKSNENSDVRTTALEVLATEYREDSEVFSLIKNHAKLDENPEVRESAIWELGTGWKDNPETILFLKDIVKSNENSDVRGVALRLISRLWMNDPETLPLLKTLAKFDKNRFIREMALTELVTRWKDDHETYPILKKLITSDKSQYVRAEATLTLAHGWKDDPEIHSLLKLLAKSNIDSYLRKKAIDELTNGWKDDPETIRLLKEFIFSNADTWLRESAITSLATKWENDPDTLPLLKTLVQSTKNVHIRISALREIIKNWKDNSDTVSLLKNLVKNEKNSEMCEIARYELARGWKNQPKIRSFLRSLKKPDN